ARPAVHVDGAGLLPSLLAAVAHRQAAHRRRAEVDRRQGTSPGPPEVGGGRSEAQRAGPVAKERDVPDEDRAQVRDDDEGILPSESRSAFPAVAVQLRAADPRRVQVHRDHGPRAADGNESANGRQAGSVESGGGDLAGQRADLHTADQGRFEVEDLHDGAIRALTAAGGPVDERVQGSGIEGVHAAGPVAQVRIGGDDEQALRKPFQLGRQRHAGRIVETALGERIALVDLLCACRAEKRQPDQPSSHHAAAFRRSIRPKSATLPKRERISWRSRRRFSRKAGSSTITITSVKKRSRGSRSSVKTFTTREKSPLCRLSLTRSRTCTKAW